MMKTPLHKSQAFSREAKLLFGKLLLRNEIPLEDARIAHLLQEKKLRKRNPILQNSFYTQCLRCGNKNPTQFSKIPCAICNVTHLYCRKCIQMGRVMACEPLYEWTGPEPLWEKHHHPCTWNGRLTKAQEHAANLLIKTIQKGKKELLIWAVCGSGKTEMLFPGITEALKQGKRICIATPRADVVRELKPRIQTAFQKVSVEALYGGSKDTIGMGQIILATTHQLLRFKEAFDVVIIDEIDAFPYHHDRMLPYVTKRAKKSEASTIYLTATPRKEQKRQMFFRKLRCVFIPKRYHNHPLPEPQFQHCFFLSRQMKKKEVPNKLLTWIQQRQKTRQLLIFVPTISLAKTMSHAFQKQLQPYQSALVHANDPAREEKVVLFREKKIDILWTTTILERGVTFPKIDVAVLHADHDVFDEAALVQIAGRAGRSPEDPKGEVVFFYDVKTNAMMNALESIRYMNRRGGRA